MRTALSAATALMLVACGGQGGNDQQAGKSGAEGGGGMSLQPGQWEMTTEVLSMNVPNMPAGVSPPMPPPTTVSMCLTPEQAAQPNADFFTGSGENGGCRSENMSMNGGRIQGTVQCDVQGTQMRAEVTGQFASTSYEITQQVQTNAQGMTMNMETRTRGRRTGECSA